MFVNDVDPQPGTKAENGRRGTNPKRADDLADTSDAIVISVLALVLISLAIIGSIVFRESLAYLGEIFSM
jgi:hypothetical protein